MKKFFVHSCFIMLILGFLVACNTDETPNESGGIPKLPPAYHDYNLYNLSNDDYVTLRLSDSENAYIYLDGFSGLAFVKGGNHVAFSGDAETCLPAETPGDKRALLRFKNQRRITGMNVTLDAGCSEGLDALIVGNDDGHLPNVELIDFKLVGGKGRWEDKLHPDGFQAYGDMGDLYLINGEVVANYQGLFLDPQHKINLIFMDNIDIKYGDEATGYALYFNEGNKPQPKTEIKNVRVYPKDRLPAEKFAIAPASHWEFPSQRTGDKVCFPYLNIDGCVTIIEQSLEE